MSDKTLPCWKPRNVIARMNRARNFPTMTDSASRHAAMIAEALMTGRRDLVDDEPEHCGVSIGVTVELLWKARAEIARLRAKLSAPLPQSVVSGSGSHEAGAP